MFLVKDRRLGMDHYVFAWTDPRLDGYKGEIIDGVTLVYDMNDIHLWLNGDPSPEPQLGRDPKNQRYFKVFKFLRELREAGFELVQSNTPFVVKSWSDYRKQYYPDPEEYAKSMSRDEWFDFLEEADSAMRIRKTLSEPERLKRDSNRDQIAEWVANRHMGMDGGIQQVWFLDSGSPSDEIRLLEVSERYIGDDAEIEPIDFGLDVEGAKYKLFVADITLDHLKKIEADPAKALPKNWKIDKPRIWDRRGPRQ